MRFCMTCGAQAGPGLRFCTSCGANLQPAAPPGPGPVSSSVFPDPAPWPAVEMAPPPPSRGSWAAAPGPVGSWDAPDDDAGHRWPLVAMVGAVVLAALLIVGGSYLVADRIVLADDTAATAQEPGTADPGTGSGTADAAADEDDASGGAVRPVGEAPIRPRSVTASCQAPPGVDAAGAPVTYDPAHTLDGVGSTAWRCAGSAVGQRLVFDFGRPVTLASVGLVPGYAKIDPVDGTDRFGENRTVTGVTWRFDGGAAHRQEIAVPGRTMAQQRLSAPVTTARVVLEITRTGNDGAIRDFTTISDVVFVGSE